jgi:hypothetical protein
VAESALPATKRCRLMEMIELKPWINRARANTPEADVLASGVMRVALLDKRRAKVSKLQVPGKASKKDRLLARIRLARDGAAFNAIHGSNSIVRGYSRANSSIGDRAGSTHAGDVVSSSLTDANYDLATDKVLGRGRGDPMMSEFHRRGDKIRDMGRPSPASRKPEGPQDLRLNPPKKKPWYQFWGDKEAPKPEPMDVKAPLFRKRYWAESSIVRRGILQEGFFKPPVRRALQDAKKVGTGFVKDLVPVDWMAADGWKNKLKGAAAEAASYGAGKLTGLPVVPYHTGTAALDVAKKRQAIQARYKRMKQAKTHLMPEMEEVPVKFTRRDRAKPLWAGNHGMRGVE